MLIVGLAFKLGAVPFHMWVPDAYEGAATPVTTFMSVGVKAAAVAVLVRVLVGAFGDPASMGLYTGWTPVIVLLAVATMVYGNLAALAQTSVKRMLAYSSVAHAGYILVGLAAVHEAGSFAVSSVLYYIAAYTVSNVLAFGSLILMGSKGKEAVSYDDLAGAGRRHPMAAFPFVIGVLSLLGMPPTAGFFGKYYVFSAAVQAGGPMIWVAVIGVLASAVGAYYYLKVIVYLFMREPEEDQPIAVPMQSLYVTVALVLAGLLRGEDGGHPESLPRLGRLGGFEPGQLAGASQAVARANEQPAWTLLRKRLEGTLPIGEAAARVDRVEHGPPLGTAPLSEHVLHPGPPGAGRAHVDAASDPATEPSKPGLDQRHAGKGCPSSGVFRFATKGATPRDSGMSEDSSLPNSISSSMSSSVSPGMPTMM